MFRGKLLIRNGYFNPSSGDRIIVTIENDNDVVISSNIINATQLVNDQCVIDYSVVIPNTQVILSQEEINVNIRAKLIGQSGVFEDLIEGITVQCQPRLLLKLDKDNSVNDRIIDYKASKNLSYTLTDNIGNPLIGYKVCCKSQFNNIKILNDILITDDLGRFTVTITDQRLVGYNRLDFTFYNESGVLVEDGIGNPLRHFTKILVVANTKYFFDYIDNLGITKVDSKRAKDIIKTCIDCVGLDYSPTVYSDLFWLVKRSNKVSFARHGRTQQQPP